MARQTRLCYALIAAQATALVAPKSPLCYALIAAQATALVAPKSPLITVAKTLPLAAALAAPAAAMSTSPLVAAWDRGAGACEMRPIVQSAPPDTAALAATRSTQGWKGLWEARIEHFEKVASTGLRVRPFYGIDADGGIVSDVHVAVGPLKGWVSASGYMLPVPNKVGEVDLFFDDFWVAGDTAEPRASPSDEESNVIDKLIRDVGRLSFFEGIARFPVDYFQDDMVAFRFTAFDSQIVARRAPDGARPQRVEGI